MTMMRYYRCIQRVVKNCKYYWPPCFLPLMIFLCVIFVNWKMPIFHQTFLFSPRFDTLICVFCLIWIFAVVFCLLVDNVCPLYLLNWKISQCVTIKHPVVSSVPVMICVFGVQKDYNTLILRRSVFSISIRWPLYTYRGCNVRKQDAVLSQGGPRDAAVNFDTYRILLRHRVVSLLQHGFLVGLCLQAAVTVNYLAKSDNY